MSTPQDRPQPDDPGRPTPGPPYGQGLPPGYGQGSPQGWGQGYPPGWGQGYPPGHGGGYPPRGGDHPQATTSLVLGILGLVLCQLISPFAWRMGRTTLAQIDASGGQLGGRGQAQAGYVCGLIGTVLLALAVAFILVVALVAVVGGIATSTS